MTFSHYRLSIILLNFLIISNCSVAKPAFIGSFAPCPDSPNCVSTRSNSLKHSIKPFSFKGKMEVAKNKLRDIITQMPGARIVLIQEKFMHVEFTSNIFGFVDDVEFYFNIASTLYELKQLDKIGKYLRAAIKYSPHNKNITGSIIFKLYNCQSNKSHCDPAPPKPFRAEGSGTYYLD